MGNELKLRIYFRPPQSELVATENERRRVQGCKDRADRHYAALLKELDERIEELRANVSTAMPEPENR